MNILNQQIEQQPNLQMVTQHALANTQHSYRQVMRVYENLQNVVWNNPNFTAAEIIGELGTNAADVMTVQEKLAECLNGLVSGCVTCNRESYTKNEDGTVTLN